MVKNSATWFNPKVTVKFSYQTRPASELLCEQERAREIAWKPFARPRSRLIKTSRALPVCDAHGTLVGIISERDVVRAFAKDGARLADRHVRDLMTREVVTCAHDQTMLEAEKLMHKHRVRHIPVMDGAKLVGMLSIRDIMVWRWQELREEVNVLRDAMIAVRNR